jgi:hypothetical protein
MWPGRVIFSSGFLLTKFKLINGEDRVSSELAGPKEIALFCMNPATIVKIPTISVVD